MKGKTTTTQIITALALTFVLIIGLGIPVFSGNVLFAGSSIFGGCKDTNWEVDLAVHSIDIIGQNTQLTRGELGEGNCVGDTFDFDKDLTTQRDYIISDRGRASNNPIWNEDRSGIPNIVVSMGELIHADENCNSISDDDVMEHREIERGEVSTKYDYHAFCFKVRVKTDADFDRWTVDKYLSTDSKWSEDNQFISHETSLRQQDLYGRAGAYPQFDDDVLFKYEPKYAVSLGNAPPCLLLGRAETPFPDCEGNKFDGNVFIKFTLDPWSRDINADGENYEVGIMGAYLIDTEGEVERGSKEPNNRDSFRSDFEAESDLEAGARLNLLTLQERIYNSRCPSIDQCDVGRTQQEVLVKLPAQLLAAMYYEKECNRFGNNCKYGDFSTVNGYIDYVIRVDVVSSADFVFQAPYEPPEIVEPKKGEKERGGDITTGEETGFIGWITENAIILIAVWLVFIVALAIVKFMRRTPVGMVATRVV